MLMLLFGDFEPLAVVDQDVPLYGSQDDVVDLIRVATLFWVGQGEIDEQVIESVRVKFLDLVEQEVQMVRLKPSYRLFANIHGSI